MLNVIYQDQNFLVVNKPNNLAVQKSKYYDNSLEEILSKYNHSLTSLPRNGIIHRLDRQTTGLILVAKNLNSFNFLTSLFKEKKIKKTYLALVNGIVENESGEISFYIQKKFTPRGKIKMILTSQEGKLVKISFQTIERLKKTTFLKIFPSTGRTHQIRVAFQNINHPLVNDPLYNSSCDKPEIGQFLHAYGLEFTDQVNQFFSFQAKLPDFFKQKLQELESQEISDYF